MGDSLRSLPNRRARAAVQKSLPQRALSAHMVGSEAVSHRPASIPGRNAGRWSRGYLLGLFNKCGSLIHEPLTPPRVRPSALQVGRGCSFAECSQNASWLCDLSSALPWMSRRKLTMRNPRYESTAAKSMQKIGRAHV